MLAGALLLASTILGACGGGYYRSGYYVRSAPPAPRYMGARGYAPGPGYVWTDGYWGWGNNNWRWNDGRWMRPPRGRSQWVAPQWHRDNRGYRFERGRWR